MEKSVKRAELNETKRGKRLRESRNKVKCVEKWSNQTAALKEKG